MYSVVLMMAMTGTPDAAAFGHKHGCDGGCTGCTGYVAASCYGCQGYAAGCCGCHGTSRHAKHSHSCCGCTGAPVCGCCGTPVYTACYGCYGAPIATPPPVTGPPPVKGAMLAAPATIVVSLPADATLKMDGNSTQSTSELRTFATPVLPIGQSFHYTLTASVVRDGQTLTTSQQVTVQAGVTSRVELPATTFGMAVAAK
jgi:uncharacterized protein (TIGR03000 family)